MGRHWERKGICNIIPTHSDDIAIVKASLCVQLQPKMMSERSEALLYIQQVLMAKTPLVLTYY